MNGNKKEKFRTVKSFTGSKSEPKPETDKNGLLEKGVTKLSLL